MRNKSRSRKLLKPCSPYLASRSSIPKLTAFLPTKQKCQLKKFSTCKTEPPGGEKVSSNCFKRDPNLFLMTFKLILE